jgi:hypothetical protein
MPSFEKAKTDASKKRGGDGAKPKDPKDGVSDSRVMEPRCHVCVHKNRKIIDRALATGRYPYRELERTFGVDHRSLSNHDKNHLSLRDAAMREIIKGELEDFDDAVKGQQKWVLYLETTLDKAMDDVINGDITVEPRDAVALIEKLQSLEEQTADAQLSQVKIEFHAYLQAMKEIVDDTMWDRIFNRAQALALRSKIDDPKTAAPRELQETD